MVGQRRKVTSPQAMITAATATVTAIGVLITLIFTTVSDTIDQVKDIRQQIRELPEPATKAEVAKNSALLSKVDDKVNGLTKDVAGIDIPEIPAPQVNVTTPKGKTQVIVKPVPVVTAAPAPAKKSVPSAARKPKSTPSPTPAPNLLDLVFPPAP